MEDLSQTPVKKSPLGRKFLFIFCGIAVALILLFALDAALRVYHNSTGYFKAMAPNTKEMYETSEFTSSATISSQGLRNDEVEIKKSENTVRILVVGDSFSFGWGIDKKNTWPSLVEKNLRESGKNVEVINAGLPGAGLRELGYVCEAYADRFSADVIILQMYMDDLYQGVARQKTRGIWDDLGNVLPTLSHIHGPIIGAYRWQSESTSGKTLRTSLIWKASVQKALKKKPRALFILSPKIRNDFLQGLINPGWLNLAVNEPTYLTYLLNPLQRQITTEETEKNLRLFKKRCDANRPTLVVFIPSTELVSEYYHPARKDLGFEIDPALITFNLDTYLKPIIEKQGFFYASPLKDFRKDGCKECYYPYDGHFTARGNNRFAEFATPHVVRFLEQVKNNSQSRETNE